MAHDDEGAYIEVPITDQPIISRQHQDSSHPASTIDHAQVSPSDIAAPEKELTMCAIQLAVLEKAASGLGTLGFVWATVVLLGGFAITLQWKDFGFVTVTLLIEGTRIFGRSHELELRHQATGSLTEASQSSFHAIKSRSRLLVESLKFIFASFSANNSRVTNDVISDSSRALEPCNDSSGPGRSLCNSHNMHQLPLSIRFISGLFYWLQLVSAMTCVVLSMMRLASKDFGQTEEADKANRDFALIAFYVLALAEALVFLAEKAFWEWKANYCGLLEKVNAECRLGPSGMVSIKRFFYDVYSKCVNGSVFDGLKMDLVTFAKELLFSNSASEQLMGTRILLALLNHQHLSDDTLRKIGTSTIVIERLIEILNWENNPSEEEIRYLAAVILSKLADKKQYALRVVEIPGAMESISSLLYSSPTIQCDQYDLLAFNLLGLLILKKLAKNHDNCVKIGNTHGLLDKIIEFTSICQGINPKVVKRSLQIVKMLAGTSGNMGLVFRREILEVGFTISNIRDILRHGGHHPGLQRLALEVLTNLAMDREARERIGSIGGMVMELFGLFLESKKTRDKNMLRVEAGEALAILILENKENCSRILKHERTMEKLAEILDDPLLSVSSSRILHNLFAFAGPEWSTQLSRVVAGFTPVWNAIMVERRKVQLLEVSLGLATQMLKTIPHKFTELLRRACLSDDDLVKKLVEILAIYSNPSIKAPQIRRFAIELTVEMMTINKKYLKMFKEAGIARELSHVTETTSEIECFDNFSGSWLSKHQVISLDLVLDEAFKLLGRR